MRPKLEAMVLCDAVFREPASQKVFLLGLCNAVVARTLPAQIPKLTVYVALSGIRVRTVVDLAVVRLTQEDSWERVGPVIHLTFEPQGGPLDLTDLDLVITGLELPQYGEYRFGLTWEGEPLDSKRFQVIPMEGKE